LIFSIETEQMLNREILVSDLSSAYPKPKITLHAKAPTTTAHVSVRTVVEFVLLRASQTLEVAFVSLRPVVQSRPPLAPANGWTSATTAGACGRTVPQPPRGCRRWPRSAEWSTLCVGDQGWCRVVGGGGSLAGVVGKRGSAPST
jgi:hypothetical protein